VYWQKNGPPIPCEGALHVPNSPEMHRDATFGEGIVGMLPDILPVIEGGVVGDLARIAESLPKLFVS
jgi:hypothetical protein